MNFLVNLNYSKSVSGLDGAVDARIKVEVSKNYISANSKLGKILGCEDYWKEVPEG